MLRIRVAGTDVVLHPSGTALLPAERTLLVADAHFGKAESFRKLGVPVPSGPTSETLDVLSAAVADTRARRIAGMHRIEPRAARRFVPARGQAISM
jgi:metallophosphoesterase superfamily enzyme